MISIHLMLLFIPATIAAAEFTPKFQYISCYCLSFCIRFCCHPTSISIHLMLLFISKAGARERRISKISIHLMLLFIKSQEDVVNCLNHFNTSHVTVYQIQPPIQELTLPFQYISCYCLSIPASVVLETFCISIHLMLLFIFVSEQVTQLA